jgi:flagellar FliL protein
MAKETKPAAAEAAPKKSRKKLVFIIVLLLVVILAIAAAGAFLLMKRHSAEEADEEEVVTETVKKKNAPPVYVAMDAFTVNLAPDPADQYVQLILSVEVASPQIDERIKAYTPKIRNNVMMLLSSKKAAELLTKEGKEKLAVEIRDQMNQVLAPNAKGDDAPVKEVLFTSFIIQ